MKVTLVSDLHLECADIRLPGGEVLLLAGDIAPARLYKPSLYTTSLYTEEDLFRPDRVARFFAEECFKYEKIFYVMGNHEHYDFKFDKTYHYLKYCIPDNVTILEREHEIWNGTLFIGATLWTDCNNNDPVTMMAIRDNMNDYQLISKYDCSKYRKLTPNDTALEFYRTKKYLEQTIKKYSGTKVVVITHHGPTYMSVPPRYRKHTLMNGAYVSKLDDLILDNTNIKFWCHGHTHDKVDYEVGECRVLCNPRGYYPHEADEEYSTNFNFEI